MSPLLLVPLFILALGLFASAIAGTRLYSTYRALARCRTWRPVRGRVTGRSIRVVHFAHAGRQYLPVIAYRYTVDGKAYSGDRLCVGVNPMHVFRRRAERRIERYEPGRAVQVLVDPERPAESVLECRAPHLRTLWALLALVWTIMLLGAASLLLPGFDGPQPMLRL